MGVAPLAIDLTLPIGPARMTTHGASLTRTLGLPSLIAVGVGVGQGALASGLQGVAMDAPAFLLALLVAFVLTLGSTCTFAELALLVPRGRRHQHLHPGDPLADRGNCRDSRRQHVEHHLAAVARMMCGMAVNGQLPRGFARLDRKTLTPCVSVLTLGSLSASAHLDFRGARRL